MRRARSQTFNAVVVGGQAFQIPVAGRDRLIVNGVNSATGGNLVIDIGSGAFGGLVSSETIRSVEITCDINFDLVCGVIDIQHGTTASPVPLQAWGGWLLVGALASLGAAALWRAG